LKKLCLLVFLFFQAECKKSGLPERLTNEVVEKIEKNVACFLEKYADELPMYAQLENQG
jgi:hypothetical protein